MGLMNLLTTHLQAKSAMWEARHKVESDRVRTMVLSLSGYYVKAAQVIIRNCTPVLSLPLTVTPSHRDSLHPMLWTLPIIKPCS